MTEEDIVAAHLVPDHKHVYCVAPGGDRINFAAQQMRALNLAYSISRSGKYNFNHNCKVAVVGAGVTGITIAVALYSLGCLVDVFDANDVAMKTQKNATHRTVHPSINFWPTHGDCNPTTDFPFLNWGAQRCSDVINTLTDQWKKYLKLNDGGVRFFDSSTVSKLHEVEGKNSFVEVLTKDNGYSGNQYSFGVHCFGYSEEEKHHDDRVEYASYWTVDSLEDWKSTAKRKRFSRAIVSGSGDGALVDAIRLCYKAEGGKLCLKVANLARSTPLASRLSVEPLDRDCLIDILSDCHDDESCSEVFALLKSELENESDFIFLVGRRRQTAYDKPAAPIHKFLIAYAEWKDRLSYRVAEIKVTNETPSMYKIGDREFPMDSDKTRCIVRHGAKLRHGNLVTEAQLNKLEQAMSSIPDVSKLPIWGERWPTANSRKQSFLDKITDANAFAAQWRLEANNVLVYGGAERNVFVEHRDGKFLISDADNSFQFDHLFGIKIEHSVSKPVGEVS